MTTAFITHPSCARHHMGDYHPECPERLAAISDQLIISGVAQYLDHHEAPRATREQIQRVHPRAYVDRLEDASPSHGLIQLDPDTAMNAHSLEAAYHAAGAVVLAADMVMRGEVSNAFCSVRPPGHHAERRRAMGFCLFNNVAIGVAHALAQWGLRRVAVVDFDVHHGNGTEEIFSGEERVLMVSTFQHPFYPFSGTEHPATNMVNVPLAAGDGGEEFRRAVTADWLPALRDFSPEMLFISAGFDAHREDDMASLGLVEADYAWVTRELVGIAGQSARGRIVSVLEGGYALSALGRSVVAHLRALAEI
ncbi:MAG: histone deacetylase family protein [Betaproteobacteria bacterium]|nr:histone deacetylase family protein [Betaproteobacteria bacterium]